MGFFSIFLFTMLFNYLYATLLPFIKLLREQIMKAFEFMKQNSVQIFCSFISSLSPLICPYYCCFSCVVLKPFWPHFLLFLLFSVLKISSDLSQPNKGFHILFWSTNLQKNCKFSPIEMERGRSKILVLHIT